MEYRRTDPKDWPKPAPRHKEVMADMTDDMQRFLVAAAISGVRPDKIGRDPEIHDFHPATLGALKNHCLVHLVQTRKKGQVWRPTDDGRGLAARHVPLLLHRKPHRNYTHDPKFAARGEPEVMDHAV